MFVPISPRRWCLRLNPVSIPSPSPRRRISGSTLWIFGLALSLLPTLLSPAVARASGTVVEAELTIEQALVDFTGTPTPGMTVNGTIPGPTLRFREGDLARIHVHNRMDVPTSVHWHGLLVPPDMDGAPLISSSPIAPGTTFIYEFPIRQSGTYWYHSHTALQEQQGVYGSIVIEPAGTRRTDADVPDRDHVVLFSDWTDTDPHQVLRQLRRGSEWFAVERGTGQSLLGAWRLGMLGDWLQRELQRMPAMDIADVSYDRFLANGAAETRLTAAAGERVRLRLIDGSASTFFHVEFAGGPMVVVAADGIDVVPFEIDRLLMGVAETYDVIVRMPDRGSWELRATAHDASGHASVWLGEGERHEAPTVPYPNLYESMGGLSIEQVFAWTPAGTMGMSDAAVDRGEFDQPGMHMDHGAMDHGAMHHGGMDHGAMDHGAMHHGAMDHGAMDQGSMDHGAMDHGAMHHGAMHAGAADHTPVDHKSMHHEAVDHKATDRDSMDQGAMHHDQIDPASMDHDAAVPRGRPGVTPGSLSMGTTERSGKRFAKDFRWLGTDTASRTPLASDGGPERPWAPYERLRSLAPTRPADHLAVRELRLTLDGNMERYVWFLDQTPLSASDVIEIAEGELVRFILINRTMMHHPMHLHGHFFRVLNGQGDHAPLKHTVNVEPMSTTVIEFVADEVGDWLFHCHLLYHMKSGMSRLLSYRNFEPPAEVQAIRSRFFEEHWYRWGSAQLMSHRSTGSLQVADTLDLWSLKWEVGWQEVDTTESELTLTWDRTRNRFLSYFLGVDIEAESDRFDDPRAVAGLRYLLPGNIDSMVWIDSDGEARLELHKHLELTPRLALSADVEYDTANRWEQSIELSYLLNPTFDLVAGWHSEHGVGGGLSVRF